MSDTSSVASETDYTAVAVHDARDTGTSSDASSSTQAPAASATPARSAADSPRHPRHSPEEGLPRLAPRYLDSSVKLDAMQRMSQQRREAAATKSRLQSMFRQLDDLERKGDSRREEPGLPAAPSRKAWRRHEAAIMRHRNETAYRPVIYSGPATKSPSPVKRMIRGEAVVPRAKSVVPMKSTK